MRLAAAGRADHHQGAARGVGASRGKALEEQQRKAVGAVCDEPLEGRRGPVLGETRFPFPRLLRKTIAKRTPTRRLAADAHVHVDALAQHALAGLAQHVAERDLHPRQMDVARDVEHDLLAVDVGDGQVAEPQAEAVATHRLYELRLQAVLDLADRRVHRPPPASSALCLRVREPR